jgi:hypothetical protein
MATMKCDVRVMDEKMEDVEEEEVGGVVGATIGKRKTFTSLSGHRFDYSNSTTTIAICIVRRRLNMYAKRNLSSSMLLDQSGPSYKPYHMMAESRPLNLLIRLIKTPL